MQWSPKEPQPSAKRIPSRRGCAWKPLSRVVSLEGPRPPQCSQLPHTTRGARRGIPGSGAPSSSADCPCSWSASETSPTGLMPPEGPGAAVAGFPLLRGWGRVGRGASPSSCSRPLSQSALLSPATERFGASTPTPPGRPRKTSRPKGAGEGTGAVRSPHFLPPGNWQCSSSCLGNYLI